MSTSKFDIDELLEQSVIDGFTIEKLQEELVSCKETIERLRARIAEAEAQEPDVDELTDRISELLRGTYHCTRVWEAWSFGTMGADDFEPADESDTPREIAEVLCAMLATAPQPGGQREGV